MKDFYSIKISVLWNFLIHESKAYFFIFLYLFIEYVRPQTIYPTIDILPYGQITLVTALLFYLLDPNRSWLSNGANRFLVLYAIVIIISSVISDTPHASLEHWIDFTQWFIVYFLLINIVNTEKKFFLLYFAFLLYSFKMAQHGFLSWAGRGFAYDSWGVSGAPGWFQNSGEFGVQICVFLPLSIYFIIALKSHWNKLKYIFFMLFPLTAVFSAVASSSRGALVGVAVAISWMLLKSKHKIKATVAVLLVGTIVYSSIPPESLERFHSAGDDPTSVMRKNRWADGFDMMNAHPFFGIGYRNWEVYYPKYYYRPVIQELDPYGFPHNIFIDAGAELGYTGLIIFILMILSTLRNNHQTRILASNMKNNFLFWTAHGLDAAMIGFLVSGSFVSVLYYPYFWINLAFTVSLNSIAKEQSINPPASSDSLTVGIQK